MRILVLEDNPERIKAMRPYMQGNTMTVFDNAKEFLAHLETDSIEYDLLLLDHDLGGQPPCYYGVDEDPNNKNTGSEVTRQMATMGLQSLIIVLHSMNPIGSDSMRDILMDANYTSVSQLPFPTLLDLLKQDRFFGQIQ